MPLIWRSLRLSCIQLAMPNPSATPPVASFRFAVFCTRAIAIPPLLDVAERSTFPAVNSSQPGRTVPFRSPRKDSTSFLFQRRLGDNKPRGRECN